MSNNYSARIGADNDTAEVVLEIESDGKTVQAKIGPRAARRIAIQILQVANDMDDLRDARI